MPLFILFTMGILVSRHYSYFLTCYMHNYYFLPHMWVILNNYVHFYAFQVRKHCHLYDLQVAWGVPLQRQLSTLDESGPWGGEDGKPWDDGIHTGVKKIILTRGDAICSIQVQYDQNGHSVWSAPHGIPYDTCTYHVISSGLRTYILIYVASVSSISSYTLFFSISILHYS